MFAVSPTDINWYKFFRSNNVPDTVNFWTPTPWNIRRLSPGDIFLFLLKAPYRKICGYGTFQKYENISVKAAWDKFSTGNGVENINELITRANNYTSKRAKGKFSSNEENREVGCIALSDVVFFDENNLLMPEELGFKFSTHIVKLKYFNEPLPDPIYNRLYDQVKKVNFPDEIGSNEKVYEGVKKQILINSYERNPIARKKCLLHYGYNCAVCSINFYDRYGEIGKDFIHVHHLIEISSVGKEYEVDPINDLRPVCPNCHAMLHQKKPAYTINELKTFLR